MYTTFQVIWSAVAAILVLLVLLHSPKGDGLGGIGGQAQLFSSTKSAENTLNLLTWFFTVAFLLLTIVLSAGWIPQPTVATPTPNVTNTAPVSPAKSTIPQNLPAAK